MCKSVPHRTYESDPDPHLARRRRYRRQLVEGDRPVAHVRGAQHIGPPGLGLLYQSGFVGYRVVASNVTRMIYSVPLALTEPLLGSR